MASLIILIIMLFINSYQTLQYKYMDISQINMFYYRFMFK